MAADARNNVLCAPAGAGGCPVNAGVCVKGIVGFLINGSKLTDYVIFDETKIVLPERIDLTDSLSRLSKQIICF